MVGVKKPLKQRQIWAIRFLLDREGRMRDRALFALAIDSKLRGCDRVKIKIGTLVSGRSIRSRAIVVQQKTGRPVQFEITADVRGNGVSTLLTDIWVRLLDCSMVGRFGNAACPGGMPSNRLRWVGKGLGSGACEGPLRH